MDCETLRTIRTRFHESCQRMDEDPEYRQRILKEMRLIRLQSAINLGERMARQRMTAVIERSRRYRG